MAIRPTSRILASLALATGLALGSANVAQASVAESPEGRDANTFEHLTAAGSNCNGGNAVHDLSYVVGGTTYTSLGGNVPTDTTVTASFTIASDCDDVTLGLASYNRAKGAPGVEDGVLVAQQTGTFAAGSSGALTVRVPACAFHLDFFTGSVLSPAPSAVLYGDALIESTSAGTVVCDVMPSAASDAIGTTTTIGVAHQSAAQTNAVVADAIAPAPATTVEATVATTTTTAPAVVAAAGNDAQLAETGAQTVLLVITGTVLLLAGIFFERLATIYRRRHTTQ